MIPAAEWQRIKGNLSHRAREAQEQYIARQRREDRKLQSQNIVKHWENTIEVHCRQHNIHVMNSAHSSGPETEEIASQRAARREGRTGKDKGGQ